MKKFLLMTTFLLSAFTLSACDVNEGGPEEFGENIEETAEDIGNSVEDACEDVKENVNAEDTDC